MDDITQLDIKAWLNQGPKLLPVSVQLPPQTAMLFSRQIVPWEITLQIGLHKLPPVRLEIFHPTVFGRADPAEGFIPNVDLTAFGAKESGLSRRHAVISPAQDGLTIRDLNSLNGTFVNGNMLNADQVSCLCVGDEIKLGSLYIVLKAAQLLAM